MEVWIIIMNTKYYPTRGTGDWVDTGNEVTIRTEWDRLKAACAAQRWHDNYGFLVKASTSQGWEVVDTFEPKGL